MSEEKKGCLPPELAAVLRETPRAALGFSGGVDSSYLLYAALTSGVDVRAYYVETQFQPRFEREDARRVAALLGANLRVLPFDILSVERVAQNPPDRCYWCKAAIFGLIQEAAAADGYPRLLDGSNASDDAGDRPGMRALNELRVASPLRRAGMTKEAVRRCAREAGLPIWDKSAYACLATRVPAGTPLEAEALQRVEKAEEALAAMGFRDFRARLLTGGGVQLQVTARQMTKAAENAEAINGALAPWFGEVALDLKPRQPSV